MGEKGGTWSPGCPPRMACPASLHVLPAFPRPVPADTRLLSKPSPHLLPPSSAPFPKGPLGLERTGSSLELFRSSWEFKAPFTGGEKKGSWPTRNSTALRQNEVERGNCRKYTLIPLKFTKQKLG